MQINNFSDITVHTGNRERLFVKDRFLPDYERESLRLLYEKLQNEKRVEVANGVFFRPTWLSFSEKDDAYKGTFFFHSDEKVVPFLLTFGARTRYGAYCIWRQEINDYCQRRRLPMPLQNVPGTPFIANLFLSCTDPDAMEYMYSGKCRDFCRRVGLALLVPEATQV